MASSSTVQVILFCAILSFSSTTTAKDDGLHLIPGKAILKNVEIWKNCEITSLAKNFGPDPQEWVGDLQVVADMSFTAMCCLYSSKIVNFIRTIGGDFVECETFQGEIQTLAGQMLTTALNFTKTFNIRSHKNVLNAISSFYLFVNNAKNENCELGESLNQKFIDMRLYTRLLIEAFAVLNCSWSVFDVGQVNHDGDIDFKIPNDLNLPEKYFKLKYLKPEHIFLTKATGIQIIDFYGFLDWRELRYPPAGPENSRLREINFRSEIITLTKTTVFQSLVAIALHFINQIIITSENKNETLNSNTKTIVDNAINHLKRFNFPGFLHVKLRKMLYQRMISPDRYKPFKYLLEGFEFTKDHKHRPEDLQNVKMMTEHLKHCNTFFALYDTESEIKIVTGINEMLCDYEYGEVGFLQPDISVIPAVKYLKEERASIEKKIPILERLKEKNCQFADVTVAHFVLTDILISQCEFILSDSNNSDTAVLLKPCFASIARSIGSLEDTNNHSLSSIIDILKSTYPHNNANRKVIDTILAIKLFLSNDNLLNSNVPLTEQGHVDETQVLSKLDMLKRYNRFIINLVEHYTAHSCSTQSPHEILTKEIIVKVDRQCRSAIVGNDTIKIIECLDVIIEDNLKTYQAGESQININDYTIENLLMDKVLEKASNNDNGLSMLHELKYSWEGGYTSLKEIVNIVKNNINPKYLCKYQLMVIKAIVFIVYDKLKLIIQSSTSSNNNFQLYRASLNTILKKLKVIGSDFFPLGIFRVYELIVESFEEYFQGEASIDVVQLIRIIEVEQYYLGMQKESSGPMVDELVLSIPDHTLGTSSKSQDVETVAPSALETDAKTNIGQLVSYLAIVEDIRTNLANVALLLDLKRMSNLQI